MRSPLLAAALAAALGLTAAPGRARAQTLEVSPVQVELTGEARTALVTLHNVGEEAVRYQVTVFAWDQDRAGEMRLTPTKDLSFFPSVLAIGPGEKRNVRVAAGPGATFGAVERTYRLFVEQLPDRSRTPRGAVRVLTRVGIPVYLEPQAPAPRAEATALALTGRRFSFVLRSSGNVRVRPEVVRAVGRDAQGAIVFDAPVPCWYVLAGGERALEATVPEEGCARVRVLSAEIALPQGPVEARLPVPQGACGP